MLDLPNLEKYTKIHKKLVGCVFVFCLQFLIDGVWQRLIFLLILITILNFKRRLGAHHRGNEILEYT